ncbi:MAG: endonuclease III [Treponema sp.]|jgi:endonuclease-3|nr:endonuclease III [Treponema sp.]
MDQNWDAIFGSLEAWQLEQKGEPSVTEIAGDYKQDPWAVLVSTILSLRTKDEVTAGASRRLLEKAPTPAALLKLPLEEIARLAYPAGFYRTKAASLRKIAAILMEQYGGAVPPEQEALLALPGVGLKTANLVLGEAFGRDAICVDIHVHRICNRAGWLGAKPSTTPDKTEAALREKLPRKYWRRINALLVRYGQELCRPQSPWCSRCVISGYCERRGLDRSR